MHCIYLPGFSLKNKEELESFKNFFNSKGLDFYSLEWPHWTHPSGEWQSEELTSQVLFHIQTLDSREDLVFVGKSIGTFITTKVLEKLSPETRIKRTVLLGIPVADLTEDENQLYPEVLKDFADRLTVIQNELDSHGTSEQVRELLKDINFNLIIKSDVDNHSYDYPEDVYNLVVQS